MPVAAAGVDSRLGARAAGPATEASALFPLPSHSFLAVRKILRIVPHFCSHSSPQASSFLRRRTARILAVSAVSACSFSAASPRRARACRHGPRARSRRLPPPVTRPRPSQSRQRHPRPPTYRRPKRSRSPSPSWSSRTCRPRSPRRDTGTRPTRCSRCSRSPRSSRRSGARASPSFSATVSRTGPVIRARSSVRRSSVGLYGLDVRGPAAFPEMQVHYWKNVLEFLRNTVGAEVFVTSVPPCVSPPSSIPPALNAV
jgi:hypothetical protein